MQPFSCQHITTTTTDEAVLKRNKEKKQAKMAKKKLPTKENKKYCAILATPVVLAILYI